MILWHPTFIWYFWSFYYVYEKQFSHLFSASFYFEESCTIREYKNSIDHTQLGVWVVYLVDFNTELRNESMMDVLTSVTLHPLIILESKYKVLRQKDK